MNKVRKTLSVLFGITSSEYAGFRLLVFTAIICSISLYLVNYYTQSPYNNYRKDAFKLDSLLNVMDQHQAKPFASLQVIHLEKFDPNTASKKQLFELGFPAWLATRIIKYRSTGARFRQPTDLKKIYGFSDSLYLSIEEYVVIKPVHSVLKENKPSLGNAITAKTTVKIEKELPSFDLNLADTAVLQTIKGIGSALSNRIVKYRSALGGFISKNQLYQIYRLDSSIIDKLNKKSFITTDFEPLKLNINEETKEQLATHPYINWTQAKLIIAYRNQHGAFKEGQDLLKVYAIDEDWLKKNAPYLTF